MTDDLTLIAGGRAISGWTEMRLTRGIERVPSDFEIAMTELYPGEASQVVVQPGDPCQIKLGADLVLTGYVDSYMPGYSAEQHSIRVTGRGKAEDLVDCAAAWQNGQISNASALAIAQKLAEPYGITVSSLAGPGKVVPQLNIMWGETVFETIERVCRWSALLVYDRPDGNLVLARAGVGTAASGFIEGANVQAATVELSMAERFSEYVVSQLSMDTLTDVGDGGLITETVYDRGVPRRRVRYVIVESGDAGGDIAKLRAQWEAARRYGRSQIARITADSWRDAGGALWTPNTLAQIKLPGLRLASVQWLIGTVTYRRGPEGSTAELELMPAKGFAVEPILAPWEAGLMDVVPEAGQ